MSKIGAGVLNVNGPVVALPRSGFTDNDGTTNLAADLGGTGPTLTMRVNSGATVNAGNVLRSVRLKKDFEPSVKKAGDQEEGILQLKERLTTGNLNMGYPDFPYAVQNFTGRNVSPLFVRIAGIAV